MQSNIEDQLAYFLYQLKWKLQLQWVYSMVVIYVSLAWAFGQFLSSLSAKIIDSLGTCRQSSFHIKHLTKNFIAIQVSVSQSSACKAQGKKESVDWLIE